MLLTTEPSLRPAGFFLQVYADNSNCIDEGNPEKRPRKPRVGQDKGPPLDLGLHHWASGVAVTNDSCAFAPGCMSSLCHPVPSHLHSRELAVGSEQQGAPPEFGGAGPVLSGPPSFSLYLSTSFPLLCLSSSNTSRVWRSLRNMCFGEERNGAAT